MFYASKEHKLLGISTAQFLHLNELFVLTWWKKHLDFTVSDLVISASNISADYSHISSLKMYNGLSHVNTKHLLYCCSLKWKTYWKTQITQRTQIINAVLETQLI